MCCPFHTLPINSRILFSTSQLLNPYTLRSYQANVCMHIMHPHTLYVAYTHPHIMHIHTPYVACTHLVVITCTHLVVVTCTHSNLGLDDPHRRMKELLIRPLSFESPHPDPTAFNPFQYLKNPLVIMMGGIHTLLCPCMHSLVC